MLNQQLIRQVEEILMKAHKCKNVEDAKGKLDIIKFNNHPIVKEIKTELLELGVNWNFLEKNGFLFASIVFTKF